MRRRGTRDNPRLEDPDPLVIVGLVIAALSAAAAWTTVGLTLQERAQSRRRNLRAVASRLNAWGTEVRALHQEIASTRSLIARSSPKDGVPLFGIGLLLYPSEVENLQILISRLAKEVSLLSRTSLDLSHALTFADIDFPSPINSKLEAIRRELHQSADVYSSTATQLFRSESLSAVLDQADGLLLRLTKLEERIAGELES